MPHLENSNDVISRIKSTLLQSEFFSASRICQIGNGRAAKDKPRRRPRPRRSQRVCSPPRTTRNERNNSNLQAILFKICGPKWLLCSLPLPQLQCPKVGDLSHSWAKTWSCNDARSISASPCPDWTLFHGWVPNFSTPISAFEGFWALPTQLVFCTDLYGIFNAHTLTHAHTERLNERVNNQIRPPLL